MANGNTDMIGMSRSDPSLCNAARWSAEDQPGRLANKLDFIGDRGEHPQLSLLPWCLSASEVSKAKSIFGEV